jgi:macrolide-specific efflux system membrane fusion protein
MRKLLLAGVVVLAVGGGAGWWFLGVRADTPPAHAKVLVEQGDLERNVAALGTLTPLEYVDVGTQVSGQLRKIHVQPGATVKAGDLLAEIEPIVYRARVEADRADLRSLEAQLAERRAQLKLAQQQSRRQGELFKANATSRDLLDSAIAGAEIAEAQVAALEASIMKARSTLAANEANLGYTRILAPMAGTIMSLTARQGQTLNANQQAPIILQIADLETMTVRTQVSEADVGKLRIGMPAYFTTLGEPGRKWTGKLRQILPTPEVVNNVVLYNALFEVANPDRRLMPQMTAQVFFVLDRAENAVLVPLAALGPSDGPGRAMIDVVTENGTERRPVTLGIRDRVKVQVLSGLIPGEDVVLSPTAAARPGDAGGRPGPNRPSGLIPRRMP